MIVTNLQTWFSLIIVNDASPVPTFVSRVLSNHNFTKGSQDVGVFCPWIHFAAFTETKYMRMSLCNPWVDYISKNNPSIA